jgi:hypothetical protein
MKLCLFALFVCAALTDGKPYSSQDVDEELAAESELENQVSTL